MTWLVLKVTIIQSNFLSARSRLKLTPTTKLPTYSDNMALHQIVLAFQSVRCVDNILADPAPAGRQGEDRKRGLGHPGQRHPPLQGQDQGQSLTKIAKIPFGISA